jgi:hypothetical protein
MRAVDGRADMNRTRPTALVDTPALKILLIEAQLGVLNP